MNKYILILLIAFLPNKDLMSCDICGCSITGNMLSLTPDYSNNFVSLGWRSFGFRTIGYSSSEDLFNQWELRTAIYPHPKLQLLGMLTYNQRTRTLENQDVRLSGIGDAVLMANYTLFQTPDSIRTPLRHYVAVGAGIKLPTGKFEAQGVQNNPNPANFQIGTGSTDWLFHLLYTLRRKSWGVTLDATARLSNMNKEDYRFGDQIGGLLYLSYWHRMVGKSVLPYMGIYAEYLGKDVKKRLYQPHTGGHGLFATVGMEMYIGRLALGASYQQPFIQTYADDEAETLGRLNTRISFLF